MPIAVVAAVKQELHTLCALLDLPRADHHDGRAFPLGRLHGHGVVLALCGTGKVAEAPRPRLLPLGAEPD